MLRLLRKKKAQTALEYALLLFVVIAALIIVTQYVQRSIQGRVRESSDSVGRQFDPTNGWTVAWQTSSNGTTSVSETRNTAQGSMSSNIVDTETLSTSEHDDWGTGGSHYYNAT